jgi:hypothetical protein
MMKIAGPGKSLRLTGWACRARQVSGQDLCSKRLLGHLGSSFCCLSSISGFNSLDFFLPVPLSPHIYILGLQLEALDISIPRSSTNT